MESKVYSSLFTRRRTALICAVGIIVVGGYFILKKLNEQKNTEKSRNRTNHQNMSKLDNSNANKSDNDTIKNEEEKEKLNKSENNFIGDEKSNDDNKKKENKKLNKFPVRVFVRFRPLIKSEIEGKHEEIEYSLKSSKKLKCKILNIVDYTKKQRKSAIPNKKNKSANKAMKKFKGFKNVLTFEDDNLKTFEKCILPSIDNIFEGNSVCAFAYGHTGSGKTHTMLGDPVESLGMYQLTLQNMCSKLDELNKNNTSSELLISCRFAELYQGKMRDLFGNLVECHVREGDDGKIYIRGPTIKDENTGKVKIQPLTQVAIHSDQCTKLIERVNESLKLRNVGSSAVHDASSRSHVFLQMELVTKELMTARDKLNQALADIVPLGAERDILLMQQFGGWIAIKTKGDWDENGNFVENENGKSTQDGYAAVGAWVKTQEQAAVDDKIEAIEVPYQKLQKDIDDCNEDIANIIKNANKCVTGTVVFVDLAGNEWGSDSKNIKNDNSVQQRERMEINKSLLSLKECVRGLHSHKSHVPYRDSKLTLVLRPHLKGIDTTGIMIANVSPSRLHATKTFNTLLYSQLVAKA